MGIPRLRAYGGPAILSYGFRPFFLLGSLYAAFSILLWLPIYSGQIESPSAFAPVDWHIHEMLFGYLAAIVTGFLLTAIPNWTGRLPVLGLPLLGLTALWMAGRVAVFFSAVIGWRLAAIIDVSFLLAVAAAAGREIVVGRNWRNLKVLVPLAVLAAANAGFHVEAHIEGISDISRRLGIAAAVLLISLIGGRIIPSFTRNWLVRENPGRLPAPFDRLDIAALAISALALAAWTVLPDNKLAGALLAAAAVAQAIRLSRWAGDRTLRDPLVLILHLAYAFVPLGLGLVALSILLPGHRAGGRGIARPRRRRDRLDDACRHDPRNAWTHRPRVEGRQGRAVRVRRNPARRVLPDRRGLRPASGGDRICRPSLRIAVSDRIGRRCIAAALMTFLGFAAVIWRGR